MSRCQACPADAKVQLALVLTVAALLRVLFLGRESFWLDETTTAMLAKAPLRSILTGLVKEADYPSGQLVVAHLWWAVFGCSDVALRMMSVTFGIAGVAVLYGLATQMFGRQVGIWAASLLAINPGHIYLSQEFRAYALAFLFILLVVWSVVAYSRSHSRWAAAAFIAASVCSMYVHYYCALTVGAASLWMLWQESHGDRRFLIRWLLINLVTLALIMPLIPHVLLDAAQRPRDSSSLLNVVAVPLTLLYGRTLVWKQSGYLAVGLATLLAAAVWWRAIWPAGANMPKRSLALLLMLVVGPFMVATVLAVAYGIQSWDDRKALCILGPALILLAYGVVAAKGNRKILLCVVIGLGSAASYARYITQPNRDDWRGVAAFLRVSAKPGDFVLVTPDEEVLPFTRYYLLPDNRLPAGITLVSQTVADGQFLTYPDAVFSFPYNPTVAVQSAPDPLLRANRVWVVVDARSISPDVVWAESKQHGLLLDHTSHVTDFGRKLSIYCHSAGRSCEGM